VIIPVYNGEKYLRESIDSIFSQTYTSIEVIVVDDGSTDQSKAIAHSFPQIRYLFQNNSGHASARNRGIRAANGDYISFLDADDVWLPEKLSLQISAFKALPELEIVTGHVRQFLSPEIEFNFESKPSVSKKPLPGYSPIAILVRRDLFENVGFFHENLQVGETISWFARAMEYNLNIKVLPDLVALRRIHGNNHSTRFKREKNRAIIQILKTSLDRRRSGD
jgi:glycosyltransferase involved in cell wall biosynthesis